jgi:protein-S-isoprenylcysteine O-methyltransferase Ste14
MQFTTTDEPASKMPSGTQMRTIDILERFFLFLLLGSFLYRMVPSLAAEPYNFPIVLSEAFTAFLVLIRKPGAMASNVHAWTVAIIGTCAPLLVMGVGPAVIPGSVGALMMLGGLLLTVGAKVFLNRSFGIVAANRGVKRNGPYRLVRHPMYLGYLIMHVGFLLMHLSWWNAAVYAATWLAMILRIRAEEEFLLRDVQYQEYSGSVRYRLVPGLY